METGCPIHLRIMAFGRIENDGRKPAFYNIDLSGFKSFTVAGKKLTAMMTVQNALDIKNEDGIYDDTGRAGYTVIQNPELEIPYLNTFKEVFPDPSKFSRPRLVKLGLTYEF